jgi:hypothetical protein
MLVSFPAPTSSQILPLDQMLQYQLRLRGTQCIMESCRAFFSCAYAGMGQSPTVPGCWSSTPASVLIPVHAGSGAVWYIGLGAIAVGSMDSSCRPSKTCR